MGDMPKVRHEAVVEVLRTEPGLLALLLQELGVTLPPDAILQTVDSNLSSRDPDLLKTLIADNVFLFKGPEKTIAVVFEVQSLGPRRDRKLAWPAYLATARAVYKCDTVLCVIGLSAEAVTGSRRLIRTGHPGFDLAPKVTGYGLLPAPGGGPFGPALTVIKVMTKELDLTTHDARMFTLISIASAPDHTRERYTRFIRAAAPVPVRRELTKLMAIVIKDKFMDGLLAQGEAKGKAIEAASLLLQLLGSRFDVPVERREQVEACGDADRIEKWFGRALSATTLDQVFAA
jgi:hypothetical protein